MGGNHFFDGTNNNAAGDTVITQTFKLNAATNLSGSYALGIRDSGGAQAGTAANSANTSNISIINAAGATIFTSYGDTTTAGGVGSTNPGWEVNTFTVNNVPAGTYTFQVTVQDAQNVDAVNLVPEPSSYVFLGAGLTGLLVVQRVRRKSRTT